MRAAMAVVIAFAVGGGIGVVLVGLSRLVGPDSPLVVHDRLPGWWQRLTAWARSRSLRLWCPDPATAAVVAAHLGTGTGRRLSRLGVSIAEGPWAADVIVVEGHRMVDLDAARARAPSPVASVVLVDATDLHEFRDALVGLAAALRWAASPGDRERGAPVEEPGTSGPR